MKRRTFKQLTAVTLALVMIFTMMPLEAFAAAARKPGAVKISSLKASGKKVTLKWKKAKYAKKYQVYRKTGKGKWAKVKTLKSSKRSYTMTGKAGTKYSFKVRGLNGKKAGKFSKVKSVTLKAVIYKYHKNVYRVKESAVTEYDVSETDDDIKAEVDASDQLNIKEGGVTVLPATDEYPGGYAVKVSSFTKDGDKYSIEGTRPEYKDVFDEFAVNKNEEFGFNKVMLADGVSIVEKRRGLQGFSVGGEYISIGSDGLSLSVEQDDFSASVTFNNPNLICDIDYSFGKINSCKVGMSLDEDVAFSISKDIVDKKIELLRGYAPIPDVPGLEVIYIIYLKIGVNGEATFEIQCTTTAAVEYKNKQIKAVPELDFNEADIKASMTVEPGVGVDVGVTVFHLDPLVSVKGELTSPVEAELIDRVLGEISCLNIGVSLKGDIGLGDCLLQELTGWEADIEIDIHDFAPLHYEYKNGVWTKVSECAYDIYPDYSEYPEYFPLVREYKRVFDGEKLDTSVMKENETGLQNCHCGVCELHDGYLKTYNGKYYWRDDPDGSCEMALDYTLYDINGDGRKELLFIDPTYEGYYSIWTLNGSKPVHLIGAQYRCYVDIHKTGYISEMLSGGYATNRYRFYKITNNALTKEPYELMKDFGVYYINDVETTQEEYVEMMGKYFNRIDPTKLDWHNIA